MNDGKGTFTDVTASNLPVDSDGNLALALGDVDGDGDLDLVCANALTQNRLYINDGKGKFVDTTASTMPTDTDNTDSVVLGDVDGDGDLDLVCGNSIAPGLQNKLYLNDGKGVFGDVTAQRMPKDSDQTDCLALADVDGDRDLDLVCGNRAPTKGAQNRLYLNDGNGTFANAPSSMMPQVEDRTFAVVTIDVNQDGDLDLYMGSSVGDSLYFNDGSGHFINTIEQWLYSNITGTNATGVMDLNGDGFPDVVQASGGQNQLHLNDGKGHFTVVTASNMPVSKEGSNSVVMGDLDGDGDVDLVFGCQGQNLLLLNDGKARFIDSTASSLPAGTDWTMELALGDVDGDGDLDFVCGNTGLPGGQNRLYLNNGKAIFSDATATSLPAATDATRAVVLGDIDGDADLDLICGNTGQNRVYINNGKGLFVDQTSARLPLGTDNTDGLALLDVDLDGDLDLLVANTGQNKLYLNDAKGVFADVTATRLPVDSDPSWAFAMGDVDGDGDVDLFVGNHGFCRVYLNDGRGGFTDGTSRMLPAGCSNEDAPALADADGDGDCDLLAGGGLYFNLLRQVHAPYLAILGADYRLDLHALPGFPTTGNVALPFIALAEKRVSIPPFGTLWLDFQFMVQLNPVVIPATTGMTSIDFRIPNDPKLQGLHLSSQALILYGPGLFRLSNANSDPIMRV